MVEMAAKGTFLARLRFSLTSIFSGRMTSKLRNLKPLVEFSFKYRNNMSQDLRSSFKYLKKLVKDRKIVICRADKDGKLLVLDFKDYNLIMDREFANQFQELTRVDLTTVHHELQQIKDKCDNFWKNLHRAGAIDDSMLFHVTGLKEREQKYHKCSGNSTKYFSDLVAAYAYPLFKTHKLDQYIFYLLISPTFLFDYYNVLATSRLHDSLLSWNTSYNQLVLNFVKVLLMSFVKIVSTICKICVNGKKIITPQTLETMICFIR